MKSYIVLLVLVLFSILPIKSQEMIEYKGDTVVMISDKDLITINTVFTKYEYLKKELELHKSLLSVDSAILVSKDSIIASKEQAWLEREKYLTNSLVGLNNTIEKQKKKQKITNGLLVSSALVILGIVIGN